MANLKYSRQREAIKEFLCSRTDHPTADMVYENIRLIYPNISLGTIYRNLSLLVNLGEIKKLDNIGGADRIDATVTPHNHFICTECGCVLDLEMDNIDEIMEIASRNFSGQIKDYNARFYGICEDCIKKEKN